MRGTFAFKSATSQAPETVDFMFALVAFIANFIISGLESGCVTVNFRDIPPSLRNSAQKNFTSKLLEKAANKLMVLESR